MNDIPKTLLPTPGHLFNMDTKKPLLNEPPVSSQATFVLPHPEKLVPMDVTPKKQPDIMASVNPEPPGTLPTPNSTIAPPGTSSVTSSVSTPLLPAPLDVSVQPYAQSSYTSMAPPMPFSISFPSYYPVPVPPTYNLGPGWQVPPYQSHFLPPSLPQIPEYQAGYSTSAAPVVQNPLPEPSSTSISSNAVEDTLPNPSIIASGPLTTLESAERKLEAVLAEVRQFESSCSTWMAQYNDWIQNNKDHPNKEQYAQYQNTWKAHIAKVDETRRKLKEKKEAIERQVFDLKYGSVQNKEAPKTEAFDKPSIGASIKLHESFQKINAAPKNADIRARLKRLSKALAEKTISLRNSNETRNSKEKRSPSSDSPSSNSSSSVESRDSSPVRKKSASRGRSSVSKESSRRNRSTSSTDNEDDERERSKRPSVNGSLQQRKSTVEHYSYSRPAAEEVCSFGYYTGAPEVIDYGHVRHWGTVVPTLVAQQFKACARKHGVSEWTPSEEVSSDQQTTATFDANPNARRSPLSSNLPPPSVSTDSLPAPGHVPGRIFRKTGSNGQRTDEKGKSSEDKADSVFKPDTKKPVLPKQDNDEDPYDPSFFFTNSGTLPVIEDTAEEEKVKDNLPKPMELSSINSEPPSISVDKGMVGKHSSLKDILDKPGRDQRGNRVLIVLRGLPGSGKSRLCQMIKEKECSIGGQPPRILCLDDYFLQAGGKYEYEKDLEAIYRADMFRVFKRSVDQNHFPLILLDGIHAKVSEFDDFVSYAHTKDMRVYILELKADVGTCAARNIHGYKENQLLELHRSWDPTPLHFETLDASSLTNEDDDITEVEMEDAMASNDVEETKSDSGLIKSKWDSENVEAKKLRLDGLTKKPKSHNIIKNAPQSIQEFLANEGLQCAIDERPLRPGEKRVRWADLEELKKQSKRKQLGFVVGQTDWDKLAASDDVIANQALNRFKFF